MKSLEMAFICMTYLAAIFAVPFTVLFIADVIRVIRDKLAEKRRYA